MNFTYKILSCNKTKQMKGIEKKIIHSIFLQLAYIHLHTMYERYDDKYNSIIALKTSIVYERHAFSLLFVI